MQCTRSSSWNNFCIILRAWIPFPPCSLFTSDNSMGIYLKRGGGSQMNQTADSRSSHLVAVHVRGREPHTGLLSLCSLKIFCLNWVGFLLFFFSFPIRIDCPLIKWNFYRMCLFHHLVGKMADIWRAELCPGQGLPVGTGMEPSGKCSLI